LAGCLTSFPDTIFAQNVSLIRMTAITSRRVVAVAGFFLVGLSLIPKMGEVVVSLPGPVIGSVSLVMFATVAVVGITTIEKVDFAGDNLLIVSLAMGIGIIPVVAPTVYSGLPSEVQIIFGGAITSTVIVAFLLNLVFNHLPSRRGMKADIARAPSRFSPCRPAARRRHRSERARSPRVPCVGHRRRHRQNRRQRLCQRLQPYPRRDGMGTADPE
jgi:xanthine/uracil permease